jgi:hypothetical protein
MWLIVPQRHLISTIPSNDARHNIRAQPPHLIDSISVCTYAGHAQLGGGAGYPVRGYVTRLGVVTHPDPRSMAGEGHSGSGSGSGSSGQPVVAS